MRYNKFTLEKANDKFNLENRSWPDPFVGVAPAPPSPLLSNFLSQNMSLGLKIGTEKARSELIIMPILAEVKAILRDRISVFSGKSFDVDKSQELTGTCDFMLSQNADQRVIRAPIIAIVEAKKADLDEGLGQCAAEMVAARIFNERKGRKVPAIYGIVSTGENWKFCYLQDNILYAQDDSTHIDELENILGWILHYATV